MALYKFLFVYLSDAPETKAGAGAGVGIQETAGVEMGVPLSLVRTLPVLRRVRGPAIWTRWVAYTSDLPNGLADLLDLELLEL